MIKPRQQSRQKIKASYDQTQTTIQTKDQSKLCKKREGNVNTKQRISKYHQKAPITISTHAIPTRQQPLKIMNQKSPN